MLSILFVIFLYFLRLLISFFSLSYKWKKCWATVDKKMYNLMQFRRRKKFLTSLQIHSIYISFLFILIVFHDSLLLFFIISLICIVFLSKNIFAKYVLHKKGQINLLYLLYSQPIFSRKWNTSILRNLWGITMNE